MKKSILIILSLLIAVLLFATPVLSVSWYTYNTEDFEDDLNLADPSATWYDFEDTAWATSENVVEDVFRTGNHSYEMDDTDGVNDETYFNWTSGTYPYFELYFKIDNATHETIDIFPSCSLSPYYMGVETTIYGLGIIEPYVSFTNYTSWGMTNYTIVTDTWYKLRWTFNYTTHDIKLSVYSNTSVLLTSGWLHSDAEEGEVAFTDSTGIGFWGYESKDVQIWIDDLNLQTYHENLRLRDNENLGAGEVAIIILVTLIVILGILYISFKEFTKGDIGIKDLMHRAIFILVGISIIGVIASLI